MEGFGLAGKTAAPRGAFRSIPVSTLAAAASLLALPAVGMAAPTVRVDRPCYTAGEPIRIAGQGYSPNGQIGLHFAFFGSVNTQATASATANPQGILSTALAAPQVTSPRDLRERVTLTATDPQLGSAGSPESTAQTNFLLSRFLIAIPGWRRSFRPSGKSRLEARGFEGGGSTLYAHYIRKRKLRKTVKVGKLQGPCGDISKRIRNVPFDPEFGVYSVRFDTARRYPNNSDGITIKIRVRRQRR